MDIEQNECIFSGMFFKISFWNILFKTAKHEFSHLKNAGYINSHIFTQLFPLKTREHLPSNSSKIPFISGYRRWISQLALSEQRSNYARQLFTVFFSDVKTIEFPFQCPNVDITWSGVLLYKYLLDDRFYLLLFWPVTLEFAIVFKEMFIWINTFSV